MEKVKKIFVSIFLGGKEKEVGELVSEGRNIYFKYNVDFIRSGLEISPVKLKAAGNIFSAEPTPFEGLFGVFSDSLPDGWGRLLMDRTLSSRGFLPEDVTPLQRLSMLGSGGMGALIYKPAIEDAAQGKAQMELDAIAKEMNIVLEGESSEALEVLYDLGGSSGGARPKILVGYNARLNKLIHGTERFPKGYEHWLIKFRSSTDRKDSANIEYAYYKMAVAAGIEMSKSKLFVGKSGKTYFGTKRFDRVDGDRLHLHSAAGLMHDNFRYSNMDYAHLMDCAFRLEKDVTAYEKILRIAAFNVLGHNRDDHSKNFSFLMDEKGIWKFSPAYDLTFSGSSHGFQSTTVMGESQAPDKTHLLKMAAYFKVKKAKEIIEKVEAAVSNWKIYAKEAGVEKQSMELIGKKLLIK